MSDRTIKEAIKHLAGTHNSDTVAFLPCTVQSVDLSTRTCNVLPIGGHAVTPIEDVQLMAEVEDGLLIEPVIGSTVVVTYSIKNVPHISVYSQLEKVTLIVEDKIQLQGGELGGLAIIGQLLIKFNNLENAFNLLNTKVNALAPTPVIPPLVPTILTEISNDSIIHGR